MSKYAWLLSVLLLGACSAMPAREPGKSTNAAPVVIRPVKVSAIGYGATSAFDGYTPGQKRLMAMRASKLDAYRALVEQVYGVRITSNTTVASLIAQHDSFRAYVDAYLRGAKVVTVTPLADGNYETVLELDLADQFYATMSQPEPVRTSEAPMANKEAVGAGRDYGANFYYAE